MEAMVTNKAFKFGGNVLNAFGQIANLPREACVEVPCIADASGVTSTMVGNLPVQCAAMNRTNINVQLLTIEAALTLKKEYTSIRPPSWIPIAAANCPLTISAACVMTLSRLMQAGCPYIINFRSVALTLALRALFLR